MSLQGQSSPKKPGGNKNRKRGLFWLGIVILFFMGLVGGFLYIYVTHPPDSGSSANEDPLQRIADDIRSFIDPEAVFLHDRFNVLCLGLDENWTENDMLYTKSTRSDTILVASISIKDRTISVLSIPRDSYVEIPGYGHDKINSAHALGGVPLAQKTVEAFLGIPIEFSVLLRVQATKHIVDALGGVDVEVEKQMDYDDNWGHLHIHLKPGYQRLNGEQALGYSRFRYDERGDFARIERQQKLLKAIIYRFKEPAVWAKLGWIVKTVKQSVKTNLATPQLIALANIYKDFDPSQLKVSTLEGETMMIGGMSVVVQDEEKKTHVIREFLNTPQVAYNGTNGGRAVSGVRVEVLNGTGIPFIGANAAEKLRQHGYDVVNVTNADTFDYTSTVIIDRRGEPALTSDIIEILGVGVVKEEVGTDTQRGDMTVIIGKDYK